MRLALLLLVAGCGPVTVSSVACCREDMEAAQRARGETNAMLAEIRDDIKALISKVAK